MSLYIHIPFCISKCAYCDFFSRTCKYDYDSYINALINEIRFRLSQNKITVLDTVYIGGGTPSLLSSVQFKKLFTAIKGSAAFASDAEITVEVNPDDVTSELLKTLEECGVNRISCGIQSMNDAALKKACRRADAVTNRKALSLIKEFWNGDVSLDLISGLPGDDEKTLLAGLKELYELNPCHISLYSLTIEESTPFGRQLSSGELAYDFDEADKLWLCGRDFLESAGYEWYEVSNFCKPGKQCRHNLKYWQHKSYVGCGSGATGTVYNKDGSGERWTNTTDIDEYVKWWLNKTETTVASLPQMTPPPAIQTFENIDLETSQFEFFMMGLRKLSGITAEEYYQVFGEALPERFVRLFSEWEKKGLCVRRGTESGGGAYCMSREGMLFLNRFLEELC